MSKLLYRIRLWFAPKQPLSRRIAQVCALSLKEVGLSVGGNVFELKSSKNRAGWLISLQVPEHFQVPAVDALALRLFLSRRVELALGMEAKSLQLLLHFSAEAKRLPFAEALIQAPWLRSRLATLLAGAQHPAIVAKPRPAPAPATIVAAQPNPTDAVPAMPSLQPGSKPVSASARVQEKKLEALLATLTDDDMYEVNETSMTDFDRALS